MPLNCSTADCELQTENCLLFYNCKYSFYFETEGFKDVNIDEWGFFVDETGLKKVKTLRATSLCFQSDIYE